MRKVTIGTTQMSCCWDRQENIRKAAKLVEEAAAKGAQVILLQELFETPYFCIDVDDKYFEEATPTEKNPAIAEMRKLAEKLDVVIPVSFYELGDDGRRYNSLAMIDAGGDLMGVYRKSHIPDFPSYEEAYYFDKGQTGFMVWDTKYLRLGGGICWDQWFPEAARIMSLMGADLLMYPTAIGRPTTPLKNPLMHDSRAHWQQTMQGHAAANMVTLVSSNRIGIEKMLSDETKFYGSAFIANAHGTKMVELDEETQGVAVATIDLDEIAEFREYWGIYRTRRPDLYDPIISQAPPEYLRHR